jgi:hypothetical protein
MYYDYHVVTRHCGGDNPAPADYTLGQEGLVYLGVRKLILLLPPQVFPYQHQRQAKVITTHT